MVTVQKLICTILSIYFSESPQSVGYNILISNTNISLNFTCSCRQQEYCYFCGLLGRSIFFLRQNFNTALNILFFFFS